MPTYQKTVESRAIFVLNRWFEKIFGAVPKEVDSLRFCKEFLRYLAKRGCKTTKEYRETMHLVGVAFSNCFAAIEEFATEVQQKPYSPDLFVAEDVIESPYVPPRFHLENKKIIIPPETKTLLSVLCGSSPYIFSILRLLLRNTATAELEELANCVLCLRRRRNGEDQLG